MTVRTTELPDGRLLPGPGEFWACREHSLSAIALRFNLSPWAVRRAATNWGFRWELDGGWRSHCSEAPCRSCDGIYPVERLDSTRRCHACGHGERGEVYERELAAWLAKHPEYQRGMIAPPAGLGSWKLVNDRREFSEAA